MLTSCWQAIGSTGERKPSFLWGKLSVVSCDDGYIREGTYYAVGVGAAPQARLIVGFTNDLDEFREVLTHIA